MYGQPNKQVKHFLFKTPLKATTSIWSGRVRPACNPSVGSAYSTTKIYLPLGQAVQDPINILKKPMSCRPNTAPALPKQFLTSTADQKGHGIDESLQEILEHPLKVSVEEFEKLKAVSRDSPNQEPQTSSSLQQLNTADQSPATSPETGRPQSPTQKSVRENPKESILPSAETARRKRKSNSETSKNRRMKFDFNVI